MYLKEPNFLDVLPREPCVRNAKYDVLNVLASQSDMWNDLYDCLDVLSSEAHICHGYGLATTPNSALLMSVVVHAPPPGFVSMTWVTHVTPVVGNE